MSRIIEDELRRFAPIEGVLIRPALQLTSSFSRALSWPGLWGRFLRTLIPDLLPMPLRNCGLISPFIRLYWLDVQPANKPALRLHDPVQGVRGKHSGSGADDSGYVGGWGMPAVRSEAPLPAGGDFSRNSLAPSEAPACSTLTRVCPG